MKIKVTDGAVTTVQDGFLSELRKWQVGEIRVAGTQWFTATRTDGDNPPLVKRFPTHAERVFFVQNTAVRAGLEQLFASDEVAELLPFESEIDPEIYAAADSELLKEIKFQNVPGSYSYAQEGSLPETKWTDVKITDDVPTQEAYWRK